MKKKPAKPAADDRLTTSYQLTEAILHLQYMTCGLEAAQSAAGRAKVDLHNVARSMGWTADYVIEWDPESQAAHITPVPRDPEKVTA